MGNAQLKDNLTEGQEFADELAVGSTLMHGQYTIVSFLNAGGFGITYSARDSLDRHVVIKECFPGAFCRRSTALVTARSRAHQSELQSIVRLFVQEARSLAKLTHPNIVGVHQVFEENNTAYMALDYVEGRDLLEIIENDDERPRPAEIEKILRKILDAIGFVHDQGLLHRDISPDNILLDSDNNPVLIDFGAAREQASKKSRVLSAMRVVKDGYSPQEFYISGSEQGPYSDLYALGASFYHLITGELPPDAQTRLSAVASGDPDPYVPLFGRMRGYEENFLRSLDIALEILPKNRIASAAMWLEMLDSTDPIVVPAVLAKAAEAKAKSAPGKDGPKSSKGLMMASVAVIALVGMGAFAWQKGWLSTSATLPQDVAAVQTADAQGAATDEAAALEAALAAAGAAEQTATPDTENANAAILSQLVEDNLPQADAETSAAAAPEQTADTDSASILSQLTNITTPDAGADADAPEVAAEAPEAETDSASILSQLTNITTPDAGADADAPEVATQAPEAEADSASILSQLTELSVPEGTAADTGADAETAAADLVVKPETSAPLLDALSHDTAAPVNVPEALSENDFVIASVTPLDGPPEVEDLTTTSSVVAVQEPAAPQVQELTAEETQLAAAYAAQQFRVPGAVFTQPDDAAEQVVQTTAPTEETVAPTQDQDVATADVAPATASPQIALETFGVPGMTSFWTVALPDEGTLFAVNGTPVDSPEAFDTLVRETFERPADDQLTLSLTLGATAETAQTEEWVLPVMQKTTFPSGLAFETRLNLGAWQTKVVAVPADDPSGVQVGDILFGHLQSTTFVNERTTLPKLAEQAYRGDTDLGFAVTRNGSSLGVGLTLGDVNTN